MTTQATKPTPWHKQQQKRTERHLGAHYTAYKQGTAWQCPETILKERPEIYAILPAPDPDAPPDLPAAHFWQIDDRTKTENCAKCGKTRPIVPTIFYCLIVALINLIYLDSPIAYLIDALT